MKIPEALDSAIIAAQAAQADRQLIEARLDAAKQSTRDLFSKRKNAENAVVQYEREIARSLGDAPLGTITGLAEAKSHLAEVEREVMSNNQTLIALRDDVAKNDEDLKATGGRATEAYAALTAALIADQQAQMRAVALLVAPVLMRGYARRDATRQFHSVDECIIPSVDRLDRPLITHGRFRTGGPEDVERKRLDLDWRDEPELLAEYEWLATVKRVVDAMQRESARMASEEAAREERDPALKKRRMDAQREQFAEETEQRKKLIAANKAREAEEEARREELFANRPKRGIDIREPGTPAPARPAQMDDAVRAAGDRAERVATDAA